MLKYLQLCTALGAIDPTLEVLCKSMIESQLPDIINGLVEENLVRFRIVYQHQPQEWEMIKHCRELRISFKNLYICERVQCAEHVSIRQDPPHLHI